MKVAVVIPACDEEASIGKVVSSISSDHVAMVVVGANVCRDRTVHVAEQAGAAVVEQPRRGYGWACQAAIDSLPDDIDTVLFMDGDAADDPTEIPLLLEPIKQGADLVIGSRVLGRRERGALSPQSRAGNVVAVSLIRLLYGHRYTDLGPFRAVRREVLEGLELEEMTYGWTVELQIKAVRAGCKVVEVPVSYRRRIGQSKVSGTIRGVIGAGWGILGTIIKLALRPAILLRARGAAEGRRGVRMSSKGPSSTAPIEATNLPPGVSLPEWALERNRWQNPRIRCALGCIRVLDEVLESNFAILHSSPRRLFEILSAVRKVGSSLRSELIPLCEEPSCIADLSTALGELAARLTAFDKDHLSLLDAFPEKPRFEEQDRLREILCELVGRLHGLLTDCLGRILEADPRSQEDTDYFLSRQFARDVDDAEWLFTSVGRLEQYVLRIDRFRASSLTSVADHSDVEGRLPSAGTWGITRLFLDELTRGLVPRLQRMIGLRGIRIDEVQTIERFTAEIPECSALISEVYSLGSAVLDGVEASHMNGELTGYAIANQVINRRFVERMQSLDSVLAEVATFIPEWRRQLTSRRALAFKGPRKNN